jgi:hypothetical protein
MRDSTLIPQNYYGDDKGGGQVASLRRATMFLAVMLNQHVVLAASE